EAIRASVLRLIVWWLGIMSGPAEDVTVSGHPIIGRIQALLEQPDSELLKPSEVAEKLHVSRSYASRVYRRVTGRGLSQVLQEMRIERAKRHLTQSDLSIKEITRLLRFSTQQHFTHFFRHATGMTPT